MIGIFGGAFDPVHHGHLRIALDVLQALQLDRVHLVPLYQAVHKGQPGISAQHRLSMLQLALQGQQQLIADDCEIRRGGSSYMLDTLQQLKTTQPDQTLCLMLGGDAFNSFAHWHKPEQILQLANLVVMQRPGYQLPDDGQLKKWLDSGHCRSVDEFMQCPKGGIYFHPVTQLAISSSDIRQQLIAGLSVDYLLPSQVVDYIHTQGLYNQV